MSGQPSARRTAPTTTTPEVAEPGENDLATTPDSARTSSPKDMFFAFAGVNLAVTNLAAGSLGIVLGLSLADVLLVYLIGGAAGSLLIGACAVKSKRTGAAVMVNARPSFGYKGTRLLTVVFFVMTACWFGVNNYFGVTAARSMVSGLGGPEGSGIDLILLLVILVALVLIAIVGYKGILRYEKITVVAMGLAVLAVAIGAFTHGIDWSHAATVHGGARVAAIIVLVAALGVGWAVSWTPYVHDFGRHVRKTSNEKAVFGFAWLGMFLGSFLTFGVSAVIATISVDATLDVGATVESVLPQGVAVVVLIVMVIGLLPANLANLLVGPGLLKTMDLKVSRTQAVIITAICGLPIAITGIFAPSFADVFKSFMLTLIIVCAPWIVITLSDFFLLHRGHYTAQDLTSRTDGAGGSYFTPGITAWVIGVIAALACASTPLYTSPLMTALFEGADLSIFVGAIVAGAIYYPWAKRVKASRQFIPADAA